jgi:hypothetical protein
VTINTRRCCFADALDARVAGCSKALKSARQYRRIVYCSSEEAHGRCAAWLDHVRRHSQFTLGTRRTPSALPRRVAVKLQGGGLLAIRDLLDGAAGDRIRDVSGLLRRALTRYGSLDEVPMETIVRRIHGFERDEG